MRTTNGSVRFGNDLGPNPEPIEKHKIQMPEAHFNA